MTFVKAIPSVFYVLFLFAVVASGGEKIRAIYPTEVVIQLETPVAEVDAKRTFFFAKRRSGNVVDRAVININKIEIKDQLKGRIVLKEFTCATDKSSVAFYSANSCLGAWIPGDYLDLQLEITFRPPPDKEDPKPVAYESDQIAGSRFNGFILDFDSTSTSGDIAYLKLRLAYDSTSFCPLDGESGRLAELMEKDKKQVIIKPKFDKSNRLSKVPFAVKKVGVKTEVLSDGGKGTLIAIHLDEPLPVLTKDYDVSLKIPEEWLVFSGTAPNCSATPLTPIPAPAPAQSPLPANIPPPPTVSVSFPTRVGVIAEDRLINADLTFTSYVDPFDSEKPLSPANNGSRRNVGLLSLTVAKERKLAFAPNWNPRFFVKHHSDLSSLPLKEAKVPTQIANDLGLGFGSGRGSKWLTQYRFDLGAHHESDRDFKLHLTAARVSLTPTFVGFNQSRAFRKAKVAPKWAALSTFRLVPTIGYDMGGVSSDRRDLKADDKDMFRMDSSLRRFTTGVDFSIEFSEKIAFNASNTYHRLFGLARRPSRNYLDANMTFDLHELLGTRYLASFDTGFIVKFQRGEQAPLYLPVNVFSLGIKILR